MSNLAEQHRLIAEVIEPLEEMGVDTKVAERVRDDGSLCLTLDLGLPPAFDSNGGAGERTEVLEAQYEKLRKGYDGLQKEADRLEELEARITELEEQGGVDESDREKQGDTGGGRYPSVARGDLTDGERETLRALRDLGGSRASGEIADEVDATLQSVRSWLPKLVQADLVQTVPDPSDGRRKLYSPVECDEAIDGDGHENPDVTSETAKNGDDSVEATAGVDGTTDGSEQSDDAVEETPEVEGTVYIASSGGSPSQVFHVQTDCPQLQRAADFVEKDRAVVPHHRPCGSCVADDLEGGCVAVAANSQSETYHKRADCPKLESANEVALRDATAVPDYDPCTNCVHLDDQESPSERSETENHEAEQICVRNGLDREAIVEALDGATAIYHVQRDLTLSRDETETLLQILGVFGTLDGGGNVPLDRAKSVVRKHVPPA